MIETKVVILAILATLFVTGWAVLGIADAFRDDRPGVSPEAEQPAHAQQPGQAQQSAEARAERTRHR